MDGMLLIDKPAGISSFGVVARVRAKLSKAEGKKIKVGHTGTLDPFATGLLILVIGKACKRAGEFSKLDKSYEAVLQLGEVSTTGDPEGEITKVSDRVPALDEVVEILPEYVGKIKQIPPIYSAVKVNGQRAYKLARQQKEVKLPARSVTVYELMVKEYKYPNLIVSAQVSSGTYIRTLAEDIGNSLGVGAYCSELRRTSVGQWTVDKAKTIENFTVRDIQSLPS